MIFKAKRWVLIERKVSPGLFNNLANSNCRNTMMFFAEIDDNKKKTGVVMHINVNVNHKNLDLLKCNYDAIYQNFEHLEGNIFSPYSKPVVVGSMLAAQLF